MAVAPHVLVDGREFGGAPRKGFNAQAGARVASRQTHPSQEPHQRAACDRPACESDLLICPRAYPSIRDRLRARAARDSPSWPRMLLRAPSRGGPCGVFVAVSSS